MQNDKPTDEYPEMDISRALDQSLILAFGIFVGAAVFATVLIWAVLKFR